MWRLLPLAAMLLWSLGCRAQESATPFPLGVYWPWERLCGHAQRLGMDKWQLVEQRLADLKAHNVDAVWVVNLGISDLAPLAERCAQYGIRLIPALGELHYNVDWRRNNWEYLEKESKRALAAAGDSPAILAWALCDEPPRAIAAEMEQFRQKFIAWGAKQPSLVVTMWGDTPTYARETGFPFICTDLYPFFSDNNPNGPNPAPVSRHWYRAQVANTVRVSLENGKTPWIMPQMYAEIWGPWRYDEKGELIILPGGILHWRAPTVGEIRWQIWSALGLGAQGLLFFVYESPVTDNAEAKPYEGPTFPENMKARETRALHMPAALLYPNGTPTPQYEAMAQAFAAVKELLPVLRGAKPLDLWPLQVSEPGWIGALQSGAQRLFVVVNDDTDNARELAIKGAEKSFRDLRSGRELRPNEAGVIQLRLEAGDGTVLLALP